ncbi:MAG: hypothetical protein ACSHWW_07080 [Nonlabens sp.]|uniref:hypothetical protein n=1 Tax=Nonlabens sp. TaxID=1888209 RepID=UPI003EF4D47C
MKIELFRLAIDFGLVVLIWMVQLLIYPSFEYFAGNGLARWHRKYARNIAIIVVPMMLAQIGLAIYFWTYYPAMVAPNIIYSILVALTWITTMLIFIPLHAAIDKNPTDTSICIKLTRLNWIRVIIWTAIVVLDIFLIF